MLVERFEAAGGREGVEAKSTPTDLVSEADLAAERAIRERPRARARPDDAILGEEGGDVAGTTGLRWVVDPLDGTVNFLFGIPQWCGQRRVRRARVGVVLDPLRDELFAVAPARPRDARTASRSRPRAQTDLATALVATGFGYDAERPRARRRRSSPACSRGCATSAASAAPRSTSRGPRRAGSTRTTSAAAQAWDVAAGRLLCAAAGLEVRDLPARDGLPPGMLAAPPAFADALFAIVR